MTILSAQIMSNNNSIINHSNRNSVLAVGINTWLPDCIGRLIALYILFYLKRACIDYKYNV